MDHRRAYRLWPGALLQSARCKALARIACLVWTSAHRDALTISDERILAIEARTVDWRRYRIPADGVNARLLARPEAPGWSAQELLSELIKRPIRIVAFDFPFCIPIALLNDEEFAAAVGHLGPFSGWRHFSWFVAQKLKLADPLDFDLFSPWRAASERRRLWGRRETDRAAGGQPPLKDRFQSVFQMTLLGNVLLSKLWESTLYRVIPFGGHSTQNEIIEVYPGATLRQLGLKRYKNQPAEAIDILFQACAAVGITIEAAFLRTIASRARFGCHAPACSAAKPDASGKAAGYARLHSRTPPSPPSRSRSSTGSAGSVGWLAGSVAEYLSRGSRRQRSLNPAFDLLGVLTLLKALSLVIGQWQVTRG